MATIRVDTDMREVDALIRRYGEAAPAVAREMTVAMTRATAQVQHDAQVLVPVDTGHLRRSITTDVTPFVGRVGSNVPYAPVVEYGRRPGAPMPPSGALDGWARRKGISASAIFAIRLRIARRGIKARPYLVPALERNRVAINQEFDRAIERALDSVK